MRAKLQSYLAWLESQDMAMASVEDFQRFLAQMTSNRQYFEHERLIHLMVTISFGFFMMFILYIFLTYANAVFGGLLVVLAVLETAYIFHYYHLENGVQKLWEQEQRITKTWRDGHEQ